MHLGFEVLYMLMLIIDGWCYSIKKHKINNVIVDMFVYSKYLNIKIHNGVSEQVYDFSLIRPMDCLPITIEKY